MQHASPVMLPLEMPLYDYLVRVSRTVCQPTN